MSTRSTAITLAVLWIVLGPLLCCGGLAVFFSFAEAFKSDAQRQLELQAEQNEQRKVIELKQQADFAAKAKREKRALRPRPCIESYQELQIGMPFSKVLTILGPSSKSVTTQTVGDVETTTYIWYTGLFSGNVTATFRDKVLIAKQATNLPTWEASQ